MVTLFFARQRKCHVEVNDTEYDEEEILDRPIRINFDKITNEQEMDYFEASDKMMDEFINSKHYNDPVNPLKDVLDLFNKLGGLGEIIFPQVRYRHDVKAKPGWNLC